MKAEDKSFTFRLPNELFEELQRIALVGDLSIAQLIRRAMREFVEKRKECL